MKFKYNWLLILLLGLGSCVDHDYTIPDNSPDPLEPGSADFSTYVAVGNSLTAGYTDGALFIAGQENSFANIIASKMAMVGGGDFTQPLMNDNIGGMLAGGQKILEPRLIFNGEKPVRLDADPTTELLSGQPGPYNNMGVPGAKAVHLIAPGYGNIANLPLGKANPYFVRMASSPNTSVLQDAMAMNPTFFTLWIGNNDVLGYAASGGDGSNPITDIATFTFAYSTLVSTLTSTGAKGVVLNIPDVTAIPYFTTVPYNPVPLDQGTADALNNAFAAYNQGLTLAFGGGLIGPEEYAKRKINFVAGQNAVTIVDEDLTDLTALGIPSYRHATKHDLLVLPSSSIIGTPVGGNPQLIHGVSVPLEDKWVLTEEEQVEVHDATVAFNGIIKSNADNAGLAFVDANALMVELYLNGISADGFNMNASLVKGGAFSLDGVHLTGRGNALVAQYVLRAIDATYGSNFEAARELPDVGDYPAFYSPSLR